jgi:hypothetical protein
MPPTIENEKEDSWQSKLAKTRPLCIWEIKTLKQSTYYLDSSKFRRAILQTPTPKKAVPLYLSPPFSNPETPMF